MATVKLLENVISQRLLGALILLLAFGSFIIGYNSDLFGLDKRGIFLTAQFESVEGLEVGSPIRLSGVEVGRIDSIALRDEGGTYKVEVSFYLDDDIILSEDSSAVITGNSIFGSKHLRLTQGGSFLELRDGDEILYTTSAVDFLELLEGLISRGENR